MANSQLDVFVKGGIVRLDKDSCLCPYCSDKLPKKNCSDCSHKDFMFEGVCFCPQCEAYFIQEEPLVNHTYSSEGVIFPEWQAKRRFYQ